MQHRNIRAPLPSRKERRGLLLEFVVGMLGGVWVVRVVKVSEHGSTLDPHLDSGGGWVMATYR